jgi:peptidoglycan/xylan/chitin deacetylase (PgdA/CDA1 family)
MRFFYLIFLLFVLGGCGSTAHTIIARDDDFIIVEANAKDDYASLAKEFLGTSSQASVIQRYNPQSKIVKGTPIAIPLKNFNVSAVFPDGYQRVPILCYHQFTDKTEGRNSMILPRHKFEAQMEFLVQNGYQVLSLRDVRAFLKGNKALPDKSVAITIDDGYENFFSVAYPILKKYNFPSTLFIYPDFVGGGQGLKWSQVEVLHEDPIVDIQSHSKSHDSLSPRPGGEAPDDYYERLIVEVETTDQILNRKIGRPAEYFAYPYGNSSLELVNMLERNGYELALTVKKGGNPTFASPYLMRRTMVYAGDSIATFKRYLDVFRKVDLK